jgi:hypothetical protein
VPLKDCPKKATVRFALAIIERAKQAHIPGTALLAALLVVFKAIIDSLSADFPASSPAASSIVLKDERIEDAAAQKAAGDQGDAKLNCRSRAADIAEAMDLSAPLIFVLRMIEDGVVYIFIQPILARCPKARMPSDNDLAKSVIYQGQQDRHGHELRAV